MPLTPAQIAALKTELQNDPLALGYNAAVPPRNDTLMADAINWPRDGVTPCPDNGVVGPHGNITGATQATPIVVTATAHGRITGDYVQIAGVGGNTAANGLFKITVINANSFSLSGSVGNGAYTSGGTWTLVLQIRNQSITTADLMGAINNNDLITDGLATAMTADQFGKLTLFSLVAGDGSIALTNADGTDNQNLHTIKQCLNDTNGSKTRVIALSSRIASRAEVLFGAGVSVSIDDVGKALN